MALMLGILLPPVSLFSQNQSAQDKGDKGNDLPEGKGKDKVANVCTQCHGLEAIVNSKRTLQEWRDLVNDMVSNGASLTDEEVELVAQYLAKNFSPSSAAASAKEAASKPEIKKINVNKSTAKELEMNLELSAKEAAAIVSYRDKNGNFNNLEELKKVPGLDAKKVEAAQDRLVF